MRWPDTPETDGVGGVLGVPCNGTTGNVHVVPQDCWLGKRPHFIDNGHILGLDERIRRAR